jgi:hypothetical protein
MVQNPIKKLHSQARFEEFGSVKNITPISPYEANSPSTSEGKRNRCNISDGLISEIFVILSSLLLEVSEI